MRSVVYTRFPHKYYDCYRCQKYACIELNCRKGRNLATTLCSPCTNDLQRQYRNSLHLGRCHDTCKANCSLCPHTNLDNSYLKGWAQLYILYVRAHLNLVTLINNIWQIRHELKCLLCLDTPNYLQGWVCLFHGFLILNLHHTISYCMFM